MSKPAVFKPWFRAFNAHRWQWWLGFKLALLTVVCGIGLLALSGWFITASAIFVTVNIYAPGSGIRFFAVTRTVARYVERLVNHDLVLKVQARWRIAWFKRFQRHAYEGLARFRVAQAIQGLTRHIEAMDNLWLRLAMPAFAVTAVSLCFIVWFSFYHWALAGIVVVTGLGAYWLISRLAHYSLLQAVKVEKYQHRIRARGMALTESLEEVMAWKQFDKQSERITYYSRETERAFQFEQRRARKIKLLLEWLTHGAVIGIYWVAIQLFIDPNAQVSSAEVVMLLLAALAWQELLLELPQQWQNYGRTALASRRLLVEQTNSSAKAKVVESADASLRWDNVSVYRQSRQLFAPISLQAVAGEWVWLSAPSGEGKSTLLNATAGMYANFSGKIAVPKLSEFNYLTQHTDILDDTVFNNLTLGRQLDEQRIWKVLEWVELAERIRQMPEQLNSRIGELGIRLSGGQYRRLALARALLKDAPLVILDEPFSGLEVDLAARITERLMNELPLSIVLVASHHVPASVRAHDRHTVIELGHC
ncbi:MAG: ABC transporter, ATP-binding and membrane protein [Idiomarina sp. T82-3]|uniref:amino acid ABC transporter ATP-binding/permease protein n=1 Tax=Idiomarina TaxID=135575 RepID=UPI00079CA88C|nr:ATP-binding cassette domain-containing protein [Idiomarina sp. T82-3]KXS36269.1 MAG: ABC transporter, ATP-binding and membrane protein [Idiomarina sp. T82-3]